MNINDIAMTSLFHCQKLYSRLAIKNKEVSIISNNCIGADICHRHGLRFNSPTVNMQILPEDYLKFVCNLKEYLAAPVVRNDVFSEEDDRKIRRTFGQGGYELSFPLGSAGTYFCVFSILRLSKRLRKLGTDESKE